MAVNIKQYVQLLVIVVILIVLIKIVIDHFTSQGVGYKAEGFASLKDVAAQDSVVTSNLHAEAGAASNLLPRRSVGDEDFSAYAPKKENPQSFLDASKYIGVDTISSSKKNSSWDLRQSIPIPKKTVSPWQNSTIDPELSRHRIDI
jgi:hypothetical protein